MEYLKPVVMDLLSKDKRKQAWDLIDFYLEHARTIADYDVLGYVSMKSDKRDTYLTCAEATYALARNPEQLFTTRMNLYKAYSAKNYPEKALGYIEQNLQLAPEDFESNVQKAFVLSLMGQKEVAEEMLLELIEKHPQKSHKLKAALSGRLLRQGKLAEGVKSFIEAFKPKSKIFEETLKMERWDGVLRIGEKVYIEGEGGIGDEIINIRFLDTMKKMGLEPIMYSDSYYRKDTDDLFRRHGHTIINDIYSIDTRCKWLPLMTIPTYLNLTEDDLWKGPYLKPLRNPKNDLPKTDKLRIGIKCSGNPFFQQDEYRKIPIEVMLSYLPKNSEIYYIDKEVGHDNVIDLGDRIETWEDTLDYIDQMDLIVSSCTSLVHAAGAMGKTTFVAVPIAEYYVWTSSRRDNSTPWYGDNFYVMRQKEVRDWHKPLSEIRDHINKIYNEVKK